MQSVTLAPGAERKLILLLAAMQFAHIMDFMVMMPLGPQLMRVLGISTDQFGWLVSAYTVTAGIAGFVSVFLVDRFDRRHALTTLFAGFLLATLACGMASDFHTLLAARCMAGMFGGVLTAIIMALIADCFPESRRGSVTGKVMSGFAFAAVAGVPMGIYLANHFDWRTPFFFVAALSFPMLMVLPRWLPSVPARDEGPIRIMGTLREVMGDRNHLYAFVLVTALMLAGFSVIAYISPYMVANVGLTEAQLPLIYLYGGIGSLVTAPLIGKLSDHWGRARTFRVACLLSMVPLLVLTHLPVVPLWVALVVTTFFMILIGGRVIAAIALFGSISHPHLRGRFLSFNSAVQQVASGVAAFLPTLVLTQDAQGRLLHYDWVGYGAAAMTLLCIWLAGRLEVRG
jgi:predicted MFS family arabinose efflux permease